MLNQSLQTLGSRRFSATLRTGWPATDSTREGGSFLQLERATVSFDAYVI
jgi:hypothetical protein